MRHVTSAVKTKMGYLRRLITNLCEVNCRLTLIASLANHNFTQIINPNSKTARKSCPSISVKRIQLKVPFGQACAELSVAYLISLRCLFQSPAMNPRQPVKLLPCVYCKLVESHIQKN